MDTQMILAHKSFIKQWHRKSIFNFVEHEIKYLPLKMEPLSSKFTCTNIANCLEYVELT